MHLNHIFCFKWSLNFCLLLRKVHFRKEKMKLIGSGEFGKVSQRNKQMLYMR